MWEAQLEFLTPTPQGKLPICYVLEKFVFPSVVGSFILLLVLVPGYLQHPSINTNCMKPRMPCDALWLLFAFTTGDSFNKFVFYSLNSWQHMQASTLPKTWQLPHVHLFCDMVNKTGWWTVKFCKYTPFLFIREQKYTYMYSIEYTWGWDFENIILCCKIVNTIQLLFKPNRIQFFVSLNGKTGQRAKKKNRTSRTFVACSISIAGLF